MTSDQTTNPGDAIDPSRWIDQYGDFLYRYAWSRLRDANAAEEVVQETFLAGVRYHEQYAGHGSEQGWLVGIMKRKIIDYVRAQVKHSGTASLEDDPDPSGQLFDANGDWKTNAVTWAPAPDEKIEMSELWDVVRGCLGTLPQGQADVFTLSVMEEMDSDEICRQLDITPSNFWVRMHRARLGLARCVGSRWNEDRGESSND
jgi:RNA polymerase sigma-70 factor (TIGR02943 family)